MEWTLTQFNYKEIKSLQKYHYLAYTYIHVIMCMPINVNQGLLVYTEVISLDKSLSYKLRVQRKTIGRAN